MFRRVRVQPALPSSQPFEEVDQKASRKPDFF